MRSPEAHSRTPTPTLTLVHEPEQESSVIQDLPVELIAEILSQLDLRSLKIVSGLSRRLRSVTSDPTLNPWKGPILRNLSEPDADYDTALRHLGELSVVPRS